MNIKENAALAITALIELNESDIVDLDFNKMIDGIEAVSWTGRIEQVKERPLMIVDGAHNVESVEALISTMKIITTLKVLIFYFQQSKVNL